MNFFRTTCCLAASLSLLATLDQDALRADESPQERFRNDVMPILQSRCFSCHNDTDRKGGFSLQTRAGFFADGYVEPGDAAASHLLTVITPEGDERPSMPKDGEPLSEKQVEAVRNWIDSGAHWPDGLEISESVVTDLDWWSFQPLKRPEIPAVAIDDSIDDRRPGSITSAPARRDSPGSPNEQANTQPFRIRTPIDAFVLAKLREKQLEPSPEAGRRTLIRRLSYDLTGLPPTPEQIEAFLNDDDPKAYERLVDRFLESPHYGERWARHWLDVVKYADTCGYDKDKLRPNAWPYRDYVIRSFNEDKPYSRFVREQIAGDVFYPGEPDGILGLGFIAAGPWDFIGHVEVPESKIDGQVARNLDRDEMVSNTLNTFCSVTIQCARCHNHKFDPFTQEHYYGLQSIFAAVDRAERPYDLDPETERKRRELKASLEQQLAARKKLRNEIKAAGGAELATLRKEIDALESEAGPVSKRPEFGYHSRISKTRDSIKWVQVDLGRETSLSKVVLHPCHDDFGGIGAGFGFPVRYRIEAANSPGGFAPAKDSGGDARGDASDSSGAGSDEQRVQVLLDRTTDDQTNPGLSPVEIDASGKTARFVRLTATKLAERSNDYILAVAELKVLDQSGKNVALNAPVQAKDSIEAPVRWRRSNLTDGIRAKAQNPAALEQLAEARKKKDELTARINTPERQQRAAMLDERIAEIRQQLEELPKGKMVYAAATHFEPRGNFKPTKGEPRRVRVLHRGDVRQPGDKAAPGTIPVLPGADVSLGLDAETPEDERRAALARWLIREDHPLTWRSIVNRVWQYHFGRGLVETPNDFGRMGARPTHPELLDWLAVEFRDGGQSFKDLHRLIVCSSVYRQVSSTNEMNRRIDSSNQLLWRANRRRLSAEEIRDSILAVSGELNKKMGGPGFYLFELEKTAHSPHYEYHKFDPEDPASHRRTVYRFIVRSQPDPFMTTLDCADSSKSTPKRTETLTSLQALSLLNNRFNLAMAKHFASRLKSAAPTPAEQTELGFRLVTGRAPTRAEQTRLTSYAETHGLPNLCRVLFNLSEFVYVD